MPFEGTEKKLEILTLPGRPSLRAQGGEFWHHVVRLAGADVLSTITSPEGDAYLLSESSLFVFDRRAVMITCGRTSLVEAAAGILEAVTPGALASFIYERKNENFPELQQTSFEEDVEVLSTLLPGVAVRLGDRSGHHLSLFHLDREHAPESGDTALELLMYGLDPEACRPFLTPASAPGGTRRVRNILGRALPGFEIDDHRFEPHGYSLNGLSGRHYHTLHVTPERPGSYASFETNLPIAPADRERIVGEILELFRPERADLVLFESDPAVAGSVPGYRLEDLEGRDLACGYPLQFLHLVAEEVAADGASALPLSPTAGGR